MNINVLDYNLKQIDAKLEKMIKQESKEKSICPGVCLINGKPPIRNNKLNKCQRFKKERFKIISNKNNSYKIRQQLIADLKKPYPVYGPKSKCGPTKILPPLWMYSLKKKPIKPRVIPREITRKKKAVSRKLNHSDFRGTFRNYIYY